MFQYVVQINDYHNHKNKWMPLHQQLWGVNSLSKALIVLFYLDNHQNLFYLF